MNKLADSMTEHRTAIALTLVVLSIVVAWITHPLLTLLLGPPLVIIVGVPTIVVLLARRPGA